MISSQYRTSHIKWIISYVMMYFKVFRMKYNVATTGNVMVCNMYMQTCRQKYCDNISLFWTFEILYKGFIWQTEKARPPTVQNLFSNSINTYVQYRHIRSRQNRGFPACRGRGLDANLPHVLAVTPQSAAVASFCGKTGVLPYLMTAAKTRKMGPYFLAALYMLKTHPNKLM